MKNHSLTVAVFVALVGCGVQERQRSHASEACAAALPAGFEPVGHQVDAECGLPTEITCLRDGSRMCLVPPGEFIMGSSMEDARAAFEAMDDRSKEAYRATIQMLLPETPSSEVDIPYPYYIDKYETTNGQYSSFCKQTQREAPPSTGGKPFVDFVGRPSDPVVNVTLADALAYARWAGKDLPLEVEWEKAARGTDGRIYPWGDSYDPAVCNHGLGYPPWFDKDSTDGFEFLAPVGSFPRGRSPYGVHDMAGNVWEWCKDDYAEDANRFRQKGRFSGPGTGSHVVLKGGSNDHEKTMLRCATRGQADPKSYATDRGFRTVLRMNPS